MNFENSFCILQNNSAPVELSAIPALVYSDFCEVLKTLLGDLSNHIANYYIYPETDKNLFICVVLRDKTNDIAVFSHVQTADVTELSSLTPELSQIHIFEREIMENFGINFLGHPWLKPVRWSHDRKDKSLIMDNYPFYSIDGEELHEVGVGPIHAGVIEPGHFRFICNGEKVLHLEIHLGYQHRGVERAFVEQKKPLQRAVLAECIAGDTAIGHGLAYSQLIESLSNTEVSNSLQIERIIALELERIAVHIGDTAALCTDVAYQFGQVVNEALRTTIINTTQLWCGNRFGKGLIRCGGTNYPLSEKVINSMLKVLDEKGKDYMNMADRIYTLPSVLIRFDGNGIVTNEQAQTIGAVGMTARSSGVNRDIRQSHPFQSYKNMSYKPVIRNAGDVLSRGMIRNIEVRNSIKIIKDLIEIYQKSAIESNSPNYLLKLKPNSFAVSVIEGWRGEICHCAITDMHGEINHYKVKDPSIHNWMALALAVRNQEISDFPINNKSFNLSYCGFDL